MPPVGVAYTTLASLAVPTLPAVPNLSKVDGVFLEIRFYALC